MSWSPGSSGGTNSVAGTIALTGTAVGDVIVVVATDGGSEDFQTQVPTDDKGNSYSLLFNTISRNSQKLTVWTAVNIGSGTVTVTPPDSTTFYIALAWVVTPPAGTVIVDALTFTNIAFSSGTDTMSLSLACNSADGLGVGIAIQDGAAINLNAGTGWTQRARRGFSGGATDGIVLQTKALTAGTQTCLMSPTGSFDGVFLYLILAADVAQSSQVFSVSADAYDGGWDRQAATEAGVDSGTFTADDGLTLNKIAFSKEGANIFRRQVGLRFDTSAIPADAIIQYAKLYLYLNSYVSADSTTHWIADFYDFGGSPSVSGDYKAGMSGTDVDNSQIGYVVADATYTTGVVREFPIRQPTSILRSGEANAQGFTGFTGLRLAPTITGFTPTGQNYWEIVMREHASLQEPQLKVWWKSTSVPVDLRSGGTSLLVPRAGRSGFRTNAGRGGRGVGRR